MFKYGWTLLCVLLLIGLFDPSKGARGFGGRHSYPSSRGGLSGGGHHSYPSSGGLSGTGHRPPSHGYPSGSGLSGGGGGHSYPGSTGLSGSGSRPQGHITPNTGYKPNSNYPNSPSHTSHTSHTTVNNHYHYNYNPPQQIRYTSPTGASHNFPVYHSPPPTYVYQYKDSGSKYGTLLAGLALLNLGVLGAGVYANSQSHKTYHAKPDEVCKFGLKKENGDYEETKIDCQIISSYIFEYQATTTTAAPNAQGNQTVVTVVTSTTIVNETNPVMLTGGEVMLPNGTLITTNVTGNGANSTSTSSVTTTITTTNTTTVNALDVKGKPIEVTPTMKCYVIKTSPSSTMKKSVDCGLLQAYAVQSLKKNSAVKNIPTFTVLTAILAAFVVY